MIVESEYIVDCSSQKGSEHMQFETMQTYENDSGPTQGGTRMLSGIQSLNAGLIRRLSWQAAR